MTNTTHTQISRSLITDALDVAGVHEYEIREDYSGRGMYGQTCFGIVFDSYGFPTAQLARFAAALGIMAGEQVEDEVYNDGQEVFDLLDRISTDSMGLGTIIYFPGVELTD